MNEERSGDSRREMIYKKAVEIAAEKGFQSTSVRDICAAIGIKESSFYIYFTKKDDILDEIFKEFESLFLNHPIPLDKIPQAVEAYSPRSMLKGSLELCFDRLNNEKIRQLWRILIVEQFRDERAAAALRKMNRRLAETAGGLLQEWKRRALISQEIAVAPTAEVFASAVRMVFYDCLSQKEVISVSLEIDRIVEFFLSILKLK